MPSESQLLPLELQRVPGQEHDGQEHDAAAAGCVPTGMLMSTAQASQSRPGYQLVPAQAAGGLGPAEEHALQQALMPAQDLNLWARASSVAVANNAARPQPRPTHLCMACRVCMLQCSAGK